MMDDKSGNGDTGEVRWSWKLMSQKGRSRRGWRSEWGIELISEMRWCIAKGTTG